MVKHEDEPPPATGHGFDAWIKEFEIAVGPPSPRMLRYLKAAHEDGQVSEARKIFPLVRQITIAACQAGLATKDLVKSQEATALALHGLTEASRERVPK